MKRHYPFLIIGGGMAGDAAVRGIRQTSSSEAIGLIGQEDVPPYNRPPLSKGLWKPGRRAMPVERIWRRIENLGVDLHLGRKAIQLDAADKQVTDDQGTVYTFDKLLLATGGEPIRLNNSSTTAAENDRIVYYRTLADYQRLRALTEQYQRFAIIGGGFIGSEMAAVLAALGKNVVMVFPEDGICARVLPNEVSQHLGQVFQQHGVRVMPHTLVQSIEITESGLTLQTNQSESLQVDAAVAGLGIRPNISLAKAAGLATSSGIEVDAFLRTSHPDIYAAGDVANFYSPALSKRMRVEHEENANLMGQLAGQNMAGESLPYYHLPSVYSTLFDINYDAVGELNPALEIVADWQAPLQKGVIYYLSQGRVRGVVLWNISRGLDVARQLIEAPGSFLPADLQGKIGG